MNVKQVFFEVMKDALDLQEVLFVNEDEREKHIEKLWKDYGDDIEEYIVGFNGEDFDFSTLKKSEQVQQMQFAIFENRESLGVENIMD